VTSQCNCCLRNERETWVHSSSIGAMSFASCRECLDHDAEPEFAFAYLYDFVSKDGEGLREVTEQVFKDGSYWTWEEWVKWRQDPIRKAELDTQRDKDYEAVRGDTQTGD
jgi:hypothetical protein